MSTYKYFTGEYFADSYLMYNYLDELRLRTGNERSGTKFFSRNNKRKAESMKFGWTWRKKCGEGEREFDKEVGLYKTVLMKENPDLIDMFREYANYHFPDFKWTEITINRMPEGTSINMHKDKKNVGESILLAFGDYKGGLTYVKENDRHYKMYDARDGIVKFNGAEIRHGVTTVCEGTRFSLVFYNNVYKKMKDY